MDLKAFLRRLPKAELHLHIEGSLEPEMMFDMARRNGVTLPYESVEATREAYAFTDLQSFLVLLGSRAATCRASWRPRPARSSPSSPGRGR